jgi:atypical dual specificity phosphatase
MAQEGNVAEERSTTLLSSCAEIEGDFLKDPVMLVLTGLPGSGKSKFCYDLVTSEQGKGGEGSNSSWVVVCQDHLGSRNRCEEVAQEALQSGHRVVIDRCNQSVEQRKNWVELAHKHWPKSDMTFNKSPDVFCISFDTPFDLCVERTAAQEDHPTVAPADALKVCKFQAKEWENPSLAEGFACHVVLRPDQSVLRQTLIDKLDKPLPV